MISSLKFEFNSLFESSIGCSKINECSAVDFGCCHDNLYPYTLNFWKEMLHTYTHKKQNSPFDWWTQIENMILRFKLILYLKFCSHRVLLKKFLLLYSSLWWNSVLRFIKSRLLHLNSLKLTSHLCLPNPWSSHEGRGSWLHSGSSVAAVQTGRDLPLRSPVSISNLQSGSRTAPEGSLLPC